MFDESHIVYISLVQCMCWGGWGCVALVETIQVKKHGRVVMLLAAWTGGLVARSELIGGSSQIIFYDWWREVAREVFVG